MEPTPAPLIEHRADVPDPLTFVRLFATTGWDPQGRLTAAAAAEALTPTWYAVSAYEGERLVGTGRIIGDGVLHALLVDVIVDPAYLRRLDSAPWRCLAWTCWPSRSWASSSAVRSHSKWSSVSSWSLPSRGSC